MTRPNIIIARTYPAGLPSTSKPYSIKRHVDDVELASGNTDSNGMITYTPNGNPGPWYCEIEDTTPEPDVTRVVSTKASGSGGAYALADIPVAMRVLGPGVVDGYLEELAVEDPDSGTNIKMNTGAVISPQGLIAVFGTDVTHAIAASQDATHTKLCYFGVEFTGLGEAEEGKAVTKEYCGTAAASPALPSLTSQQTEASWFEPLATFTLGISGATNANDVTGVTDARRYAMTRNPIVVGTGRRTDPAVEQTITDTSSDGEAVTWTSGSPNTTLLNGVVYDLEAEFFLMVKAPASQTISVAVQLAGGSVGTFLISATSADYVGVMNVSHAEVTGTGASVTNSVKAKVSSGSGKIAAGYFVVRAVPRR